MPELNPTRQMPSGNKSTAVVSDGGAAASFSFARTADVNAYAAGDVIGSATGTTAALTFANIGPTNGGEVLITSVAFERDVASLISGETSYTLHLYNVTPPSALGDNTLFDLPSGDRTSYLGSINLGTPVDLGATLYVEQNQVNKQVTLLSGSLYAYLVTAGAHTPTSAPVYKVTLHVAWI